MDKKGDKKKAQDNALKAHKLIDIRKVPNDVDRFGTVPINPQASEEAGTLLVGCDVGENGGELPDLMTLGHEIYENDGL